MSTCRLHQPHAVIFAAPIPAMHPAISAPVQLQAQQNQDRRKVLFRRQEEHRNHLCRQVKDEVGTYPKYTYYMLVLLRNVTPPSSYHRSVHQICFGDLSDYILKTWDTLKFFELSLCTGLVYVPRSPTIDPVTDACMCGAFIRAKYFTILGLYCVTVQ